MSRLRPSGPASTNSRHTEQGEISNSMQYHPNLVQHTPATRNSHVRSSTHLLHSGSPYFIINCSEGRGSSFALGGAHIGRTSSTERTIACTVAVIAIPKCGCRALATAPQDELAAATLLLPRPLLASAWSEPGLNTNRLAAILSEHFTRSIPKPKHTLTYARRKHASPGQQHTSYRYWFTFHRPAPTVPLQMALRGLAVIVLNRQPSHSRPRRHSTCKQPLQLLAYVTSCPISYHDPNQHTRIHRHILLRPPHRSDPTPLTAWAPAPAPALAPPAGWTRPCGCSAPAMPPSRP